MQLIVGALGASTCLVAQDTTKVHLEDIEVNFMSSYYQQDGNHSPVTGGRGTEFLTNAAPSVNIHIPVDSVHTWDIDGGVDFYSSASSDNINNPYLLPGHVSGPSANDERSYVTVSYKRKVGDVAWGVSGGTSMEWDVFSYNAGGSLSVESKDHNRSLDLKVKYFLDDWKRIYPNELRNGTQQLLPTDKRHTVNSSVILATNLTPRLSASLAMDAVVQQGILSTPFHRVYFQGSDLAVIEQLPDNRVKVPVGVRLNYHLADFLIVKSFYRYYQDSWGMRANTFELTLPVKLSHAWRVYPFARVHTQSAVDYFAGYQEHSADALFYTSDFDLSGFTSTKVGMGFKYSPLFGLARFHAGEDRVAVFKSISARYAHYTRSDGLVADVVSVGLEFRIQR